MKSAAPTSFPPRAASASAMASMALEEVGRSRRSPAERVEASKEELPRVGLIHWSNQLGVVESDSRLRQFALVACLER